jgi:hypothetical protein
VHEPTKMGRIVRLRYQSGRLSAPEILCKGLENGCHQIAIIGDTLYVMDTYHQLIQRLTLDGVHVGAFDPVPRYSSEGVYAPMMAHMNSIRQVGDSIRIMLHNGGIAPPERSEVLVFNRQWQLLDRHDIDGFGCHDIVPLEDGTMLYCGSEDGELIGSNGLKIRVSDHMTRGLDYTKSLVMIGTSRMVAREERDMVDGSVIFLDRAYQRLDEVLLPGAPTCIIAL